MPGCKKPAKKIGSFFHSWLNAYQQKRMIARIVDTLCAIDFSNSKLPASVLEAKANPNQQGCDLQYAISGVVRKLGDDEQVIRADVQLLDEKLLTLARLLKQAVEQGDVRAAYTAKAAVVRAVMDVRCRIPQERQKLAERFIKACVDYLDMWILLADLSRIVDNAKRFIEAGYTPIEAAEARVQELDVQLRKKLLEDADFASAFDDVMNQKLPQDRTQWHKEQREAHLMMTEHRVAKLHLELSTIVRRLEQDWKAKEAQVEVLQSNLVSLPIVTDCGLINKFQERMDALFRQFVEVHAEMNVSNQQLEDTKDMLHQMDRGEVVLQDLRESVERLAELEKQRAACETQEYKKEKPVSELVDYDTVRRQTEQYTPAELAVELFGEEGVKELLSACDTETKLDAAP